MSWVLPLLTLTVMEIVLAIDNIVFLSILVGTLPANRRAMARLLGLGLALGARVVLLLGLRWVMGLEAAVFHWSSLGWMPDGWLANHHVDAVTGKDLVLFAGGVFLIGKSVLEIHEKAMGGAEDELADRATKATFGGVIAQIVLLDVVFSLDSVISAIGMAKDVWVMIVAMLIAVGFMAVFAGKVSRFVDENPTFKMLALSFLVLIGVLLVSEAMGTPIDRGYIYAALVFAFGVELLNMRARRKKDAAKREALRIAAAAAATRHGLE
jgi:predicted tellurium resistance membrane protein TerC